MKRYIEFIVNRPKTVLIALAVITVVMALGIPKLEFDNSVETMMPKNDKDYIYFEKTKKIYGNVGKFVLFNITGKNIWTYEFFKAIDDMGNDFKEFEDYDKEKEGERIKKLLTFKGKNVLAKDLINAFNDDPPFKRQIDRLLGMNPATRETVSASFKPIDPQTKINMIRFNILVSQCRSLEKIKAKNLVDGIISPVTVKDMSGKNNTLKAIDLIVEDSEGKRQIPKTKEDFEIYKKNLLKNPAFKKALYAGKKNKDGSYTVTDFALMIRLENVNSTEDISGIAWEISRYYPQLHPTAQGVPIVYKFMTDYMKRDLFVFLPLVFLVIVIIFFLNFRSPRGVFLPYLVLAIGDIWLMGLMGHLGYKISIIGVSLPVLMVSVGSSYSIHILNQYYIDYDDISKVGKKKGLITSISHISITILLAGLTTFLGFLSLLSSEVSGIQNWGVFSAIGVVIAVILSTAMIPAGLMLLKHKEKKTDAKISIYKKSWVDPLIRFFSHLSIYHYKKVVAVTLVVLIGAVAGIGKINVETAFMTFFKKDDYVRTSSTFIGERYGGSSGMSIIVNSGKKDGIKEVEFLKKIDEIRDWLELKENIDLNIGRSEAFTDIIKSMHMAMHNDDKDYFKVPDKRSDIWDYLEIYSGEDENDDGRVDTYESYVDANFQEVMIFARLWGKNGSILGSNDMVRIETKIENYLKKTLPKNYSYRITGESRNMVNLARYVTKGQLISLFFSLFAVSIIVIMLFKNFKAGIVSLIPMGSAILINFGLMGWLGINLDMATAIIASITIGIGVDDTIHFLNTYRFFRHRGLSVDETIHKTLAISGKAICYTSLALIFGFMVLTFSNFRPVMLFGVLVAVTMVATTIGALLVLPSVIKMTDVNLDESTSNSFLWKIFYIGRFFNIGTEDHVEAEIDNNLKN